MQPVVPISLNSDWNLISRTILPLTHRFVEAAQQAGFVFNRDYNGAIQEGVAYSQMTRRGRFRGSTAWRCPRDRRRWPRWPGAPGAAQRAAGRYLQENPLPDMAELDLDLKEPRAADYSPSGYCPAYRLI